jgi:hypothetical protein
VSGEQVYLTAPRDSGIVIELYHWKYSGDTHEDYA